MHFINKQCTDDISQKTNYFEQRVKSEHDSLPRVVYRHLYVVLVVT